MKFGPGVTFGYFLSFTRNAQKTQKNDPLRVKYLPINLNFIETTIQRPSPNRTSHRFFPMRLFFMLASVFSKFLFAFFVGFLFLNFSKILENPRKSQKIPRKFLKNSQKVPRKFLENSQNIPRKFLENFQKILEIHKKQKNYYCIFIFRLATLCRIPGKKFSFERIVAL